ncbi:pre-toxin TG domain-containing protein [Streptococcus zhangguiae]|uniref:Uncharacterized protein n=1 Tax=Streptococcus zhangguiae TaxID=2664091 RepID=A0A6I4RGB9_9STRE|nr:pre-toxin TG domain-containing protein [Streptococcus sp. zg-70]MWV55907.1 hypothetical protein [Streptococcus sp. zg-70]
MKAAYGNRIGTRDVTPKEIGIKELYQVENPYKKILQASYDSYKQGKDYDKRVTVEDYLMVTQNTRAFQYESLSEQQSNIETWRDLALGAGVIVLSIFCPPAGAVAGFALASLDAYSGITGKDWGTGRELDGMERGLRVGFAMFDLIPGAKYLSSLGKTGMKEGLAVAKNSLKLSLKEGLEQGTKNIDNLAKLTTKLSDNVLGQLDNFGKQVDNIARSKVTSVADNLAGKLRHADEVISEAAQNFRLNIGMEPQLVSGTMPTSSSRKLSGLADNLSAFAKNLDGSVDDVVERLENS